VRSHDGEYSPIKGGGTVFVTGTHWTFNRDPQKRSVKGGGVSRKNFRMELEFRLTGHMGAKSVDNSLNNG